MALLIAPALQAERLGTAYHEAGHALARLTLGHAFEYVTVEPDDPHVLAGLHPTLQSWLDWNEAGRSGPCPVPLDADGMFLVSDALRYWFLGEIVIRFAGPAAEAARTGCYNDFGAECDVEAAAFLATFVTDEDPVELSIQSSRIADRMVATPLFQARLVPLVQELLRSQRLTFDEAESIVGEVAGDSTEG